MLRPWTSATFRPFLLLREHGSFQQAAAAARMSRGGLRRQIDRLEREVGVALLRRGTRGVELTASGREVASRAELLLRDAELMVAGARRATADARGVLRFVVPSGWPTDFRSRALLALHGVNPDLDVLVIEDEDPLSRINEPFDLLFHYGNAPDRPGWYSRVVMELPVRLSASQSSLETRGRPKELRDLEGHPLLLWQAKGGPHLPTEAAALMQPPWVVSANVALLMDLARLGGGMLFAPAIPPVFEVERAALEVVLHDVVETKVSIRMLSPRPSRADPKVRAMLRNLEELLAQLD